MNDDNRLAFVTTFRTDRSEFYFFLLYWIKNIQKHHKDSNIYICLRQVDMDFIQSEKRLIGVFGIDFSKVYFEIQDEKQDFDGNNQIYNIFFVKYPQECERIIYTDIDAVIEKPLYELLDLNLNGKQIAAVSNYEAFEHDSTLTHYLNFVPDEHKWKFEFLDYQMFNGGFMMIDVRMIDNIRWRIVNNLDFINELRTYKNQHILNYLFKDRVMMVDVKYNNMYGCKFKFCIDEKDALVNHYAYHAKHLLLNRIIGELGGGLNV